jgi:WD40 repeat protein
MPDGRQHSQFVVPDKDMEDEWFKWVWFLEESLTLLAMDSGERLWLWEVGSEKFHALATPMSIVRAAATLNQRTVLLATAAGEFALWDVGKDRKAASVEIDRGASRLVMGLAISSKGDSIAASFEDENRVRMCCLDGHSQPQHLVGHSDCVLATAYYPDGRRLATASRDNTVRVWDINDGVTLSVIYGEGNIIRSIAVSPDGKWLAVGNGYASFTTDNPASAVTLLRTSDLSIERRLVAHEDSVDALSFSRDGRFLASGGSDGKAIVWKLN